MNRRSIFKLLAAATACAAMEVCGLKPLAKAEVIDFKGGEFSWKPTDFTYQWFRDGQPIKGATSGEYTVNPCDSGREITVTISSLP